eukprot:597725-Prymnesium_polylepis.1
MVMRDVPVSSSPTHLHGGQGVRARATRQGRVGGFTQTADWQAGFEGYTRGPAHERRHALVGRT